MGAPTSRPDASLLGQWKAKLANTPGVTQEMINYICPTPPNMNDTAADYAMRASNVWRMAVKS